MTTFNPFVSYYDGELNVISMIFPALTYSDKNNEPAPYLASKWTTSSDGLTWTFDLRPNLKWSDGQPLTSSDIAWTYNLVMTNTVAATANGTLVANIASVAAPNANTFVIKTKSKQANLLYESLPVVPEHIWKSHVANLKAYTSKPSKGHPVVGYGPYVLTGFNTTYATLQANKNFVLGAPKYDTLISQYFSSTDAAVNALKTGQVLQNGSLTATQYNALKNTAGITTYRQAPSGWTGIEINPGAKTKSGKRIGTGNPILADPQVRKAIAYGIDKQTLVTKVLDGLGEAGAGYIPSGYPQWAWQPDAAQKISFDQAKADQILDQAGYPKGANGIRTDKKTGKPLEFRLGIHSDDSNDAAIATYLVPWMKAIGIQLKVQPMSFSQLNDNLAKGDWDILMDGWSTGPDPTYLLSIQTCGVLPNDNGQGGNTDAFFCDPTYDQLYAKQQTQFDQSARADTIRQMQNILYNADVDIMLYYKDQLSAVRTDKVTYMTGKANAQGVFPLQSLFYNWTHAAPVAAKSTQSSNTGLFIGIGIAIVVIVVGGATALILVRRRRTAADRE
ncbi:ABC transporter substrate-binding protein [Microlunatus elymi]|nr:peptide ABC transporter substrate-binding protein [Microlunatus elymi]